MTRKTGSSGPRTLDAIRKAGLRLISEHGYEAMSLRQLAGEVGIQAGSLYNHIATKQQLLVDLIRDHMEDLISSLDRALAGHDEAVARLQAFVAFHVATHMWRKQEVYVSSFELRALAPANYARVIRLRRLYEERLNAILDQGVADGVFAIADTRIATFALLAMLTGVCTWYRPTGRLDKDAIIALHTGLVLRGVMAPGGTARPGTRRKKTGSARSGKKTVATPTSKSEIQRRQPARSFSAKKKTANRRRTPRTG